MNTSANPTPPVAHEVKQLTKAPWRIRVPDDAPAIFKDKLRWAYPAYRAYDLWSAADGLRMSAAMSFYGLLSLAPLLLLLVVALGWWLGQATVQANLIAQVSDLIGAQGAVMLEGAIAATREQSSGLIASIVAMGTLLMGATGVFAELQSALERLWIQGTSTALGKPWWRTATIRLKGVGYVMAFGFLLLVSLVISSMLSFVSNWASAYLNAKLVLSVLNVVISLGITTAMFLGLMRMSSGPQPHWRHLLIGALIGALLFALGKKLLAIYLADAAVVSAYGAAGSLVVILFWIYFTSAVLLFAASCARVAAELQGQYRPDTTPPPAAVVTAVAQHVKKTLPDGPLPAAGSTAAVVAALGELGDNWQQPPAATPTAIHWAALLLAFSAGYTLLSQRSQTRLQAQTDQAEHELAQAKAMLHTQHALHQASQRQLGRELKHTRQSAKRLAFWRTQSHRVDRQWQRKQGVWQERLRTTLRALRRHLR